MRVHLQTNLVVITPDPGEELRLEAVPVAVRGAGFVPAEMTIRARGSYVVHGSGVAFLIRGWKDPFEVGIEPPVPGGEAILRARVNYSGERVVLEPLS